MTKLLDDMILHHLKTNARISITELAAHLDASRSTVKQRMRALEENGTIRQYTIKTNETSAPVAGEERVFFLVKFTQTGDISQLKSFGRSQKYIKGMWGVTGGWDCFILVSAPSLAQITSLRQKLQNEANIERIQTSAVLDNVLAV